MFRIRPVLYSTIHKTPYIFMTYYAYNIPVVYNIVYKEILIKSGGYKENCEIYIKFLYLCSYIISHSFLNIWFQLNTFDVNHESFFQF